MPDREKVLNDLRELCEYLFHEYKVCYHGDEEDTYNRFLVANNALNVLKEQPEQKHGHWKLVQDYYDDEHWQCSACGCEWYIEAGNPEDNNMRYCPKCGAKMNEENEKEK